VVHAGDLDEFAGDAGLVEPVGVVDVFGVEEIEVADADPGR